MYNDAKIIVNQRGYSSISELIRDALRDLLYPLGLTVNGFTPEFEGVVLKSEKHSVENDIVLKTNEDIHRYFINLKTPSKIKSVNAKNSVGR